MARLPEVGGDSGNWGSILNDFLSVSLSNTGTLNVDTVGAPQIKSLSVTNAALANGSVSEAKLEASLAEKINTIPEAPVTSVAGKTGDVGLTKGDVGLGNVDNTTDANKPISSATQSALDTKISNPLTTAGDLMYGGTNGAPTRLASSGANNRALIVSTAGGDPAWGQIPLGAAVSGTLLVGNGGTGRTTSTTPYGLIAAGTTAASAQQTIAPGTSGHFLKSAGATTLASFVQIAQSDVQNLTTDLSAKMTGPASATANTIPRFYGTSGKDVQGSTIYIDDSSRLGVGATSTLAKFTVRGDNSSNGEFLGLFAESGVTPRNSATTGTMSRMVSVQGNNGAYYMGRDLTNSIEFLMGTSSVGLAFAGAITAHDFELRTNNVPKFIIKDSTGHIGIGTTTPSERLTVAGNIAATGTVNGRNIAADATKIETHGMGTAVHGAVAATERPTGFACITWIGSVQPTNALTNDIWIYKA